MPTRWPGTCTGPAQPSGTGHASMPDSFIRLAAAALLTAAMTASHSLATASTPNPHAALERSVSTVIQRMQQTLTAKERLALTPQSAADFLTAEERELFATAFARLRVSEPVTVYVAFESAAGETPFWLPDRGFERRQDLDFIVDGEDDYSTWAKPFPAGEIALGIPGFSGEMK